MTIPPIYWTLLGEFALILIGVLSTVIFVVLKDRKQLREYSEHLKDIIKTLKQKLKNAQEQEGNERVLELLNALIDHVREQYQSQYGNEIASSEDDLPSVDKFILISGYQTMLAELTALENSNEAEVAWEKIRNELTPLIQNYLQPALAAQTATGGDDNLAAQLENAEKRIENLEKFKQLYFDLQNKMTRSVEEIEHLNAQMAQLTEGSANHAEIMAIIEKNKTHYIEMGQMIGMDKEQHHESVAEKMDYSDELINERKDEIKRLKSQISKQFEEIWKLQNDLSSQGDDGASPEQLNAGIDTFARQLKDAELCIETMDMEIQTLTSELSNLKNQLKEQDETGSGGGAEDTGLAQQERDEMVARFAQESKEMMSCITGLEDSNAEQSNTINELEDKLGETKELEAKYLKLQADYSAMEAKYLEAMAK